MRVQRFATRAQSNAKRVKALPCGNARRRAADVLPLADRWRLLKAKKNATWWVTVRLDLRSTMLSITRRFRSQAIKPKNGSWTGTSVRFSGFLARRDEDAWLSPATRNNEAREPEKCAIGPVAVSLER
jgi:hypothetical protein